MQQRVEELLDIQKRFADPKFAGLAGRLERLFLAAAEHSGALRGNATISPKARDDFRSLYTVLVQFERKTIPQGVKDDCLVDV